MILNAFFGSWWPMTKTHQPSIHPRLEATRHRLEAGGFNCKYQAESPHPLGLLRLEVWGSDHELRLLRSLDTDGVLSLALFSLKILKPALGPTQAGRRGRSFPREPPG
jgi:hypothetical protein